MDKLTLFWLIYTPVLLICGVFFIWLKIKNDRQKRAENPPAKKKEVYNDNFHRNFQHFE